MMARPDEKQLTSRIGRVEIDWPRTLGFYGGITLAVGLELIEWPLGIFIATVPLIKMFNRPRAARATRFVAQVFDGAAQPVGGTGTATIRLVTPDAPEGTNMDE